MTPAWANDLSYFIAGAAWMTIASVIAGSIRAARSKRKAAR